METVTLAKIVQTVAPKWCSALTSQELSSRIVLQHGLSNLNVEDVLEIIEASIHLNNTKTMVH